MEIFLIYKIYMKHIKKFNEHNTDDYYMPYDGHGDHLKQLDISQQNIDYIKNLLDKNKYNVNTTGDWLDGTAGKSIVISRSKPMFSARVDFNSIEISELEDEYFRVYFHRKLEKSRAYKCDQIDGVRELLKDKGVINL